MRFVNSRILIHTPHKNTFVYYVRKQNNREFIFHIRPIYVLKGLIVDHVIKCYKVDQNIAVFKDGKAGRSSGKPLTWVFRIIVKHMQAHVAKLLSLARGSGIGNRTIKIDMIKLILISIVLLLSLDMLHYMSLKYAYDCLTQNSKSRSINQITLIFSFVWDYMTFCLFKKKTSLGREVTSFQNLFTCDGISLSSKDFL